MKGDFLALEKIMTRIHLLPSQGWRLLFTFMALTERKQETLNAPPPLPRAHPNRTISNHGLQPKFGLSASTLTSPVHSLASYFPKASI